MPVLKIYYDETLDGAVRRHRDEIQTGLERMMREVLRADPAKCQVIMTAAAHVTPLPIYVDMQFRANDHRTRDVVAAAMQDVACILGDALGAGIRIRAFDIDQAGLHALDVS